MQAIPIRDRDPAHLAAVLALGLEPPTFDGDSMTSSAGTQPSDSADGGDEAEAPPTISGYRVICKLGEGGMGSVWRAVQIGTQREVALKLLSGGSLSSQRARQRFEREIELAARLEHSHIARVYDSDSSGPLCYYAMELIPGEHLDRYAARNRLEVRRVLELMRDVALAVEYAHQRGVMHRDLKPSNILVTTDGRPHVVDFGLAKALAEGEAGDLTLTQDGQFAGTPAFMSPEQAAGRGDSIDTRTDVYGLGATLFLLLTAHPPHDLSGPRYEVMSRIAVEDVRRPRAMNKRLSAELESLLLKALAHERDRRYGSAAEFARDIDNYLEGKPLLARAASTSYVLRKHLRRHWFGIFATAAVVAVLVGVGAFAFVRVAAERNRAEQLFAYSLVDQARAWDQAGAPARAWPVYGEAFDALARAGEPTLSAEWGLLDSYTRHPPPIVELSGHADGILSAAFCPDSRRVLTASKDATLKLWDVPTARVLHTFVGHNGWVIGCAVSPDGRYALSAGNDKSVRLWDLDSGREVRAFVGHTQPARVVAFSADGRSALSGAEDATMRLWEVESGRQLREFGKHNGGVRSLAFSPDGRQALAGSDGGAHASLVLWDLGSGQRVRAFASESGSQGVRAIAFLPDRRRAVAGEYSGRLRFWDLVSGELLDTYDGPVGVVALSPDGQRLLAGDEGRLWDIATKREVRRFPGSPGNLRQVALSLDGRLALAAGLDGTVRIWDAASSPTPVVRARSIGHGIDGRTLFVSTPTKEIQTWDVATAELLSQVAVSDPDAIAVDVALNGTVEIRWSLESFRLVDRVTSRELCRVPYGPNNGLRRLEFHGTRGLMASAHVDGMVAIWTVQGGARVRQWKAHVNNADRVQFSPDGRVLASDGIDLVLRLWDVDTGAELAQMKTTSPPRLLVFTPDGKHLLTDGSADTTTLCVYDVPSLREVRRFTGHIGGIRWASVSPDGSLVASASDDGSVRLWDFASGRCLHTMAGPGLPFISPLHSSAESGGPVLVVNRGDALQFWDGADAANFREFFAQLPSARRTLQSQPRDPDALRTLGRWYAFRGINDWAAELLERARASGAAVTSLELARCYWKLGDTPAASREFRAAIRSREAPVEYLKLCLDAVERPATQPASKPSDTGPARPESAGP